MVRQHGPEGHATYPPAPFPQGFHRSVQLAGRRTASDTHQVTLHLQLEGPQQGVPGDTDDGSQAY